MPRAGVRGARGRWLAAAVLLLAAILVGNLPLLRGQGSERWDAQIFFAPFHMLMADHARAGRLLSWNPWSNGGSPDYVDPQVGALSPLKVAVAWLGGGSIWGYRLYWLLIWWGGGVGLLLLARHLGASAGVGAVVGLGFVSSGIYLGHAQHLSHLTSFSFLPWIVWRLDEGVTGTRPRVLALVQAGALWGLSGLAGYPGHLAATGLFAGLWCLGRLASTTSAPTTLKRMVVALGLMLVVGLVVLSPTYLAYMVETRGFSDRAGELPESEVLEINASRPGALVALVSPALALLQMDDRELWPGIDPTFVPLYPGGLVLLLAVGAVMARPGDGWRWWLVAVALLFLGIAMSASLPLRGLLYEVLPPFRFFKHSALFRDYAVFVLAVLAIYGGMELMGRPVRLARRWLLCGAAMGAVALGTGLVVLRMTKARPSTTGYVHTLGVWLLVMGVAWVAGRARPLPLMVLLIGLAFVDGVGAARVSRRLVMGTTPFYQEVWGRVARWRSVSLDLTPGGLVRWDPALTGRSHNLGLPLRIPSFRGYQPLDNRFQLDMARDPLVRASVSVANRIYFAPDPPVVNLTTGGFHAWQRRAHFLGLPPLLIHSPQQMEDPEPPGTFGTRDEVNAIIRSQAPTPMAIELLDYRPDRLRFRVQCPGPGWLLVTDRWSRGWRATVNGTRSEIWGGNFVFRALRVAAGSSDVEFVYRRYGWPWLLILSWGSLASILVVSFWTGREGR